MRPALGLFLGSSSVGARIAISASTIPEDTPIGSTVGVLSVVGGEGPYTFAITADPDNKFELVGNQLRTTAAFDFETATSHAVTVEATGTDAPPPRTFNVGITNVFEGPDFNVLTLSASTATQGEAATIDILGATSGSTITGTVPEGMTLNSAARTITGTPAALGASPPELTESGLDGAPVTSNPALEVVAPAALNNLTLPASASRDTTITLSGTTSGSAFEAILTPPGWTLNTATGEFDIAAGAPLGDVNWSVREVPSNPFVQARVSSGSVNVNSGQPALDFIAYGQSNLIFWVTRSDSGTPAPHPDTLVWDRDTDQWGAPQGEGVIRFLNAMQAATGRQCRLVYGGVSGVPIDRLQKGHPDGNYEALLADINASGIDPAYIIWHQGEGDAAGTAPTAGAYQVDLDTLHGSLVTDTSKTRATLPIVLSSLATTTSGSVATDEAWETIQNDLATINASYPNIHFSHSNMTAVRLDTFHWNAASYGNTGELLAQTVQVLEGLLTTRPNWSFDTAAERVTTTTTRVNVVHALGTDFTPTTGITGFEVSSDAGSTWVSATGAREDADSIILTHADLGTSTRLIRYQYGRNPDVSGAVLDNSALQVPLQYTVGTLTAPGLAAAPILTYQNADEIGGGQTQAGSITLLGVTEESLLVFSAQHRGVPSPSSFTLTAQPSGTVLTTTLVDQSTDGERPSAFMYQATIPANTTSIDFSITYTTNPFARGVYHAWTSPVSGLNSTTAVDQFGGRETSVSAITGTAQTSAGGFVIALFQTRDTGGIGVISGDETYAVRDAQEKSNSSWVIADTQDVSANADSDVTATFTGTNEAIAVVVGSWR